MKVSQAKSSTSVCLSVILSQIRIDRSEIQRSCHPHTHTILQLQTEVTSIDFITITGVTLWTYGVRFVLTVPFMMPIIEVTSSERKSVCKEWMMGTPPHTAASKLKLHDGVGNDGMR